MRKRKRVLSLVLVLAMLFSLAVPVQVRAEEAQYTYMSSQEMYNWLSTQRGSSIRPQNLWQAEHCINNFFPEEWVPAEGKESVFYQIVGLTDSLVSGKTSDLEKARAIFDWVSQNIAYDYTAYGYSERGELLNDDEKYMRYSQATDAFYTFYNRRGVCDGYAHLSWLMLTIAEIPGAYISGLAHGGGRHAWNAVYCDGRWILFDATWKRWDMAPDYHDAGLIQYSDGVFCRSMSGDGIIWYWIFQGYPCPADVTIPAGVIEINTEAFINCSSMTSVTIPDGVVQVNMSAFEGCTNLTSVTFPASVTLIKSDAFKGCSSLSNITFLGGMPTIEEGAFDGTAWLGNQGDFAINGSILVKYNGSDSEVVIPSGVTAIADSAFRSNYAISRVVIPEGVTAIGEEAFSYCRNLSEVVIPASVNTIGWDAFADTPWQENQGDYPVVNGILIKYQGVDVGSVVVPNGVWAIADGAFYGNSNIRSIVIPASVTRIGWEIFSNSYLAEVNFGGTREQWDAVYIDGEGGGTNWKFRDGTTVLHCNYPYAGY